MAKKLIMFSLALAFSLAMAGNAFAASLHEMQVKDLDAIQTAEHNDYNDATLVNLYYVGSATEAVVEVTSGTLTVYEPIGTSGISYNLTNTSYDTLGELCDTIEGLSEYECTLTGGKRDDSSVLLDFVTATQTTTDAKQAGGYEVTIDTGGIVETDPYILRVGITPSNGKSVILKQCRVENDGTGTLTVYGKLAKHEGANDGVTRNDTTLIWTEITAAATSENVPSSLQYDHWLEFAEDAHVVISAGNSTTTQASPSFLECFWEEK